jgi:hypothetical protein
MLLILIGTNMVMLDGVREQGEYSQDRPARGHWQRYSSIRVTFAAGN